MAASFRSGPPEGDNPGSGIFGFAVKGQAAIAKESVGRALHTYPTGIGLASR